MLLCDIYKLSLADRSREIQDLLLSSHVRMAYDMNNHYKTSRNLENKYREKLKMFQTSEFFCSSFYLSLDFCVNYKYLLPSFIIK